LAQAIWLELSPITLPRTAPLSLLLHTRSLGRMRAALMPMQPVLAGQLLRRTALAIPTARLGEAAWRLTPPSPAKAAVAARGFAAEAGGLKPKIQDGTLEGRYATALFVASSDRLDKVYQDLVDLRSMIQESVDFKFMIETPGVEGAGKVAAIEDICEQAGSDVAIVNFMKVLVENRRLRLLPRMIDIFESFYRAEKGLVLCRVTSAEPLSSAQKGEVYDAMTKRADEGQTLMMEYDTNPALMGGLVVKMGEAIFDFSVAARLERMQNTLLAPMS